MGGVRVPAFTAGGELPRIRKTRLYLGAQNGVEPWQYQGLFVKPLDFTNTDTSGSEVPLTTWGLSSSVTSVLARSPLVLSYHIAFYMFCFFYIHTHINIPIEHTFWVKAFMFCFYLQKIYHLKYIYMDLAFFHSVKQKLSSRPLSVHKANSLMLSSEPNSRIWMIHIIIQKISCWGTHRLFF